MHVDDVPVRFMGIGEGGKHHGKRFVRVPWKRATFICADCNHRWDKPDDVLVGD